MKKLGIYTFWSIPNYGAFLQAYSMRNVLSDRFPEYDVKQIAYIDKVHFSKYYNVIDFQHRFWAINPRFYKNLLKRLLNKKRIYGLRTFLKYYEAIPHTMEYTKEELKQEKFDVVVLGSDIIWDYSQRIFNNDEMLFGNGFNAKKKIAYAASFGSVKNDMNHPEYVKAGLRDMNYISVRDENSADIVNKEIGKRPLVVCDPTFLWDFSKDSNIVEPDINYEYIIVYGSDFKPELIEGIKEHALDNNMKIVCLNSLDDRFDWSDININQDSLSPFEWVGYFSKACMVFTCTYHGLMFGLIFNKRIVFSPRQFIIDKASSLIDYLGLNEVLVDAITVEEKINWNWDYNKINDKINKMKDISFDYLSNAIGD